jgi:hypothetical protein
MRHADGRRLRSLAAAVGLWIGLSMTGCAGFVLRQDVESARANWTVHPGAQRAALYAEALHDAYVGQAYVDHAAELTQRADEALAALGAAERSGGPQLPTLIAYRGLLLLDLGRNEEGWTELQRSMAIAPTVVAARGVVSVWGVRGRSDKVAEACARTLPAMRGPESRFQLLDLCVKNMHAATEAAALAWAPPEALAFYRAERKRREDAAALIASQQAMDASELANQQALLANQQALQAAQMANQAAMDAAQQAAQMAATPP